MTCENGNQCCSYGPDNTRCLNIIIKASNHCALHYRKAIKLYKNYKKICNIAYNLDINKEIPNLENKRKYLINCYVWLNKAFDARLKHRMYAFVPECYDEGHDLQFTIIKKKIKTCESQLSNLYQNYTKEYEALQIETTKNIKPKYLSKKESKDSKSNQNRQKIKNIPTKLKKYSNNRKESEREINQFIKIYLKENKAILKRRSKIDVLIISFIKDLFEPNLKMDIENAYFLCIVTHHLTFELYGYDYFDEDYEPEKCKNCDCGEYVVYNIKLACGCVFKNDSIKSYFNLMSEPTLRKFYEILLRNKEKIKPIIEDAIYYYKWFDSKILLLDMELKWDEDQNRLVLSQNSDPKMEKQSKFLSSFRLKKEQFLKKYNEQYGDDSDTDSDSDNDSDK